MTPTANTSTVAAESHGNARPLTAKKRDGLASWIRLIAPLSARISGGLRRPQCGEGSLCCLPCCTTSLSFQPLPQRDSGGEGADHYAHQGQRAQNSERGAERDRPRDRRVRRCDAEEQYGNRQWQDQDRKQEAAAPQSDGESGPDKADESQRRRACEQGDSNCGGCLRLKVEQKAEQWRGDDKRQARREPVCQDRKSTRLN